MEPRIDPQAFSSLLDAAPDGVVVADEHGTIVYANQQVEHLFGYARAELVGERVERLVPDEVRGVHVGHRTGYQHEPRRRPMGTGIDLVGRRKDGSVFPVEISLSPLATEGGLLVTAIVRDVTERRRTQDALSASEERYRLLAENAQDVIYKVALDPPPARVQYISPSIMLTGHAPEAFYERPELLLAVVHPGDRAIIAAMLANPAAVDGPLTVRFIGAHGQTAWLEHRIRPVRDADRVVGIEGIARDITDRVRIEEERRLLLADSEMQRERERIAADLHDGVMQSIYGVGLSLRRAAADLGDHEPAAGERIAESIEELSSTIADIRRYVMDLRPVRFTGDLGQSLSDVARLFEISAAIPTTLEIEAGAAVPGEERAVAMFHVAREALSNVRRHSRATAVTISLRRDGDAVCLAVRDNGVGFPAAADRPEGHFGLQNMHMRARVIGGALEIDSRPGDGTTVSIRVPLDSAG